MKKAEAGQATDRPCDRSTHPRDTAGKSRRDPGTGAALSVNSRLDESALVGDYHGLDPVPELQLGQDAGHVCLDGRFAQKQRGADLGVGAAVRDPGENLQFPWGERVQAGWLPAPGRGRRA